MRFSIVIILLYQCLYLKIGIVNRNIANFHKKIRMFIKKGIIFNN
jgi:hypothetical protein